MKIFVSWSGELSHKVALILKEWFPNVIQAVEIYVSSEDLDKGTRWFTDIATELEGASFGIVCLTRENIFAPWILFESGAISKSIHKSNVSPLLIDLSPSDLKGPLVQFQATTTTENDIRKLVKTVNKSLDEKLRDSQIEASFKKWWPDFERSLDAAIRQAKVKGEEEIVRDEREILEEVLQLSRTIARSVSEFKPRIEVPAPPASQSSIIQRIQVALEMRRKPFLAIALQAVFDYYFDEEETELFLVFRADAKHLADNLSAARNMKLLREVCKEVFGREVSITIHVGSN